MQSSEPDPTPGISLLVGYRLTAASAAPAARTGSAPALQSLSLLRAKLQPAQLCFEVQGAPSASLPPPQHLLNQQGSAYDTNRASRAAHGPSAPRIPPISIPTTPKQASNDGSCLPGREASTQAPRAAPAASSLLLQPRDTLVEDDAAPEQLTSAEHLDAAASQPGSQDRHAADAEQNMVHLPWVPPRERRTPAQRARSLSPAREGRGVTAPAPAQRCSRLPPYGATARRRHGGREDEHSSQSAVRVVEGLDLALGVAAQGGRQRPGPFSEDYGAHAPLQSHLLLQCLLFQHSVHVDFVDCLSAMRQ
jgi:hypothetical protein